MRRLRALAILASLAIAVGGAGLAKAETAAPTAQTPSSSSTATVKCTVSKTTDHNVSASDTGSTAGSGGTITGYSIDWGDGSHTATTSTPPSNVTHHYTGGGPFEVNETLYGNPNSNFGGDGHETDECAGSPVSFSSTTTTEPTTEPTNPPTTEPQCKDDHGKGDDEHADDPNTKHCGNQEQECKDGDTDDSRPPCTTPPPPKCTEANENTDACPQPPACKVDDKHPNGDGDHDADDRMVEDGGTCPNSNEFKGATFYAAEDNPMHIVVDASAVNAPPNKTSNGDPIPGDKITTTDCHAPVNACNSVASHDVDNDITDYTWTFTAWRFDKAHPAQPDFVEQYTVDSHTSPSAAQQFTKTQGDDVVQITLTITEGNEGSTVIQTPAPKFDPATGSPAANKPPEWDKPATEQGDVIIEPCDHGGLITAPETLGDTLGDAIGGVGPLLGDPNVNGPLSSAIEQGTVTTPLASVGNEVACLVSFIVPGQL